MTNRAKYHSTHYGTEEIRQELNAILDDASLDAFCMDYVPDVYDKFGRGMRRDEKLNLLLDHFRRSGGFGPLLDAVQKWQLTKTGSISARIAKRRGFLSRTWHWLASRIVHRTPLRQRYFEAYCRNLAKELRIIHLLGRYQTFDLRKIYIPMRLSKHRRPELLPDPSQSDLGPYGEDLRRIRWREESIDIEVALNHFSPLVLLGAPGTGKTTMLRYLALSAAQGDSSLAETMQQLNKRQNRKTGCVPIFVSLNEVERYDLSLLEAVTVALEYRGFRYATCFVEYALAKGSCLCLFDGLDEVIADQPHERIVKEIDELVTTFPNNLFIVSSRIAGFRYLLRGDFTLLELVEFDQKQIHSFLERRFLTQPRAVEELLDALDKSPRMQLLASNPLLLSIIALIYELDTKLPERRVELYDRCVWVLLEEWERAKDRVGTGRFPPDLTRSILELLALHFHQRKRIPLSQTRVLNALKQLLPKGSPAQGFLGEVVTRTGLLQKTSRTSYGFIHLTIQEFLAAQAIEKRNNTDLLLEHVDDPWWREVIILVAGLQRNATTLIKCILKKQPESLEALLLAAQCLTDADETEPTLRAEVAQQLVSWFKETNDQRLAKQLEELADVLGEIPWSELATLLRDPEPATRSRTAHLMGKMGYSYAVPFLVDAALHDDAPEARAAAADALGSIGGATMIDQLLSTLYNEHSPFSLRAAEALTRMDAPLLLRLLQDTTEKSVIRQLSAEALGRHEEACRLLPPLFASWVADSHARRYASESLRFAFVVVPEGEFLVGADSDHSPGNGRNANYDEKPQHSVYLDTFCIARYPVTEAQYERFVTDAGYRPPEHWQGSQCHVGREGHPVVYVSWEDANAYCEWLTHVLGRRVRLPSEVEWEKAASWDAKIGGKHTYPWGSKFDPAKCNTSESNHNTTTPVGKYSPDGDSSLGCVDMVGNVREWCSTAYAPYPYDPKDGREELSTAVPRVQRGGSFYLDRRFARCTSRLYAHPTYRAGHFGFRIVIEPSRQQA